MRRSRGSRLTTTILIPAFRPTFLRQALASALTQGGDDFEILVSDDSGGDDIQPVVESFRDPRIRYLRTAGRIGGAENCRFLWDQCRTSRMMFLFDDDLLMPHALAELTAALDAHPGASFSFGQRYRIDAAGRVTDIPSPVARLMTFDGAAVATGLVGTCANHIGELSNVLIDRSVGLGPDDLLVYMDLGMHVVADVGFYLNATRRGPAVRVGLPVAAFRTHGAQNSSPDFNPKFAVGIVEWELFIRGEYDAGRLPQADALKAIDKLTTAYERWSVKLPLIGRMAPGLRALRPRVEAGETGVLDVAFRAEWTAFVDAVLNPAGG